MSDTQKQVLALQVLAHAHEVARMLCDPTAAEVLQGAMKLDEYISDMLVNHGASAEHMQQDVLMQAFVYATILHRAYCLL